MLCLDMAEAPPISNLQPPISNLKMNKINQLFAHSGNNKLLSLYFCAGCPTLDSTADIILAAQRRGIAMLEVGIPFSDPLADGPVIQEAATKALKNGMSLRLLFSQLREIKNQVNIPLVMMGYLNPILHYGIEEFCKSCVECGVSGAIIPDLPFKDYMEQVKPVADKYDIRIMVFFCYMKGIKVDCHPICDSYTTVNKYLNLFVHILSSHPDQSIDILCYKTI